MEADQFDARMMRLALTTAARGLGTTAPNPSVGAVIADPKSKEIIARGWTAPGGRPHAEIEALAKAGPRARGATLYVTLEPCSHTGQTPPCVDAILASGLSRVVAGVQDPDPRVAGAGLSKLRAAGMAVQSGILGREAEWLNRGHSLRVTLDRPFVQLKLAIAADGAVPRGQRGQPAWVTGAQARAAGHFLRARADAILVGGATMRDDNPALTCRLAGLEHRSPIRIVATSSPRTLAATDLFRNRNTVPVWLIYDDGTGTLVHRNPDGENLPEKLDQDGLVPWPEALAVLADCGVTRLLVEGGPTIWRNFTDAGLVDEVIAFVAGARTQDDSAAAAIEAMIGEVLGRHPGAAVSSHIFGDDRRFVFRPKS